MKINSNKLKCALHAMANIGEADPTRSWAAFPLMINPTKGNLFYMYNVKVRTLLHYE